MSSFDRYARSYSAEVERSISFIGRSHDFFLRAKAEAIVDVARRLVGEPSTLELLDIGCGIGLASSMLSPAVGKVTGVDISEAAIEEARSRHPHLTFDVYDGRALPYPRHAFDLAFAICVLHHVPRAEWSGFVSELARVVRPGGLSLILEHNPYNPFTRLAVSRCAFDENAELLSRSTAVRLIRDAGLKLAARRDILFVPWYGPTVRKLEAKLGMIPLGAQYLVAGRTS